MAWLGKISTLGNLSDFAGAVNKFSESVKNIERNFDSALGFDPKSGPSEAQPAVVESKQGQPTDAPVAPVIETKDSLENGNSQGEASLLNNVFGFARANFGSFEAAQTHVPDPGAAESSAGIPPQGLAKDLEKPSTAEQSHPESAPSSAIDVNDKSQEVQSKEGIAESLSVAHPGGDNINEQSAETLPQAAVIDVVGDGLQVSSKDVMQEESANSSVIAHADQESAAFRPPSEDSTKQEQVEPSSENVVDQEPSVTGMLKTEGDQKEREFSPAKQDVKERLELVDSGEIAKQDTDGSGPTSDHILPSEAVKDTDVIVDKIEQENGESSLSVTDVNAHDSTESNHSAKMAPNGVVEFARGDAEVQESQKGNGVSEDPEPTETNEVAKLKADLKLMEAALHGAAKQSQLKADEISRLITENEDFKSTLEDLKSKTSSVELDALREEYQQRVGAAERKVYALTKERDMLRREQSRKSDSSLLLKEKDEIIKQVMAEGEELSKKQAVQEGTMRKLRAQIRELEEEKQRLNSKLQVEEGKVESIRKDKAVTETALQEAVEKGQAELASLREYYVAALNEAKDSEARAEARADSEAKADLERRFRESSDREMALLQNLEDLRQALSRAEQQAAFREDVHKGDLDDLEKRCQAAETRYEELVSHMPDSTRPLRRQIEALQESTAMRVEAWSGVERSLNSRLQEAEAKTAAAQERERAVKERLAQTLSRVAVMEAQLSMLRAEQSQLTRSLEKERQRASEGRQEYLAAIEMATTLEGRAKQLEEEFEEARARHKEELKEERARRHALEQECDQEKALIADYEKRLRADGRSLEKTTISAHPGVQTEFSSSHKTHRRLPSVSSAGSVEENYVQVTMEPEGALVPRLSFSDRPPSPFVRGPGTSLEQLESQLRQKEGELSSCFQRLAALESTRDSLAEELVSVSTQCESLRTEVGYLPGLRAELESLRRRHTAALELMGERDEEVEELKADLADIKQMYREQITMLVSQIERLSATIAKR